ncbi:hypothetical protein K7X08_002793 [Anisodus acutangulus]|uniref:Uncharacterized protein n=1 Tax=Anisodus acutangulus TaxID=402998 RepID=A0A9Q1MCV6_9SOLA|nr:hypothetical protein K7X08_002793 [Anisodus acutangulus]
MIARHYACGHSLWVRSLAWSLYIAFPVSLLNGVGKIAIRSSPLYCRFTTTTHKDKCDRVEELNIQAPTSIRLPPQEDGPHWASSSSSSHKLVGLGEKYLFRNF